MKRQIDVYDLVHLVLSLLLIKIAMHDITENNWLCLTHPLVVKLKIWNWWTPGIVV